jgi:hypothetical protein
MRNTSAGGWKLRTPLRGLDATSEPAVEISAKGWDEPVVRNLPEVKQRITLPLYAHTHIYTRIVFIVQAY